MASSEDRRHAERLLKKKRARLHRLEEQEADFGINTEPVILNEIEDLRRDIATLQALLEPPPSDDVQEIATRIKGGEPGDFMLLFTQYVLLNTRMTRQEEKMESVLQQQGAAQIWRMDVAERLEGHEQERIHGQRRNFRLAIGNFALLLLMAILLWIVLARAGVL